MTAAPASAPRTRVLFLYNIPDWAIHNVGRDWAALLEATHEFEFMRFGDHEREDPEAYDHVLWGYSTLGHSGRMLLESIARRPLAWWRWKSHSNERFAAVVQDPSEVFPEVADWKHARPRLSHLRRFSRLAVTSNEMRDVLQGLGYEATRIPTHSLLPLRERAALVLEPLRVFTRAQAYPRKNLGLFMALPAFRLMTIRGMLRTDRYGCNRGLPETTLRSSIPVLTVSTSRVVMVMLRSHSFSSLSIAPLPWTPMLAMCPPAATRS